MQHRVLVACDVLLGREEQVSCDDRHDDAHQPIGDHFLLAPRCADSPTARSCTARYVLVPGGFAAASSYSLTSSMCPHQVLPARDCHSLKVIGRGVKSELTVFNDEWVIVASD